MVHGHPRLQALSQYPLPPRYCSLDSLSQSTVASATWLKHRQTDVWYSPPRDLPTSGRWMPNSPQTLSRSWHPYRGLAPSSEWQKSRPGSPMDHWLSYGLRIGRPFLSRDSAGKPPRAALKQIDPASAAYSPGGKVLALATRCFSEADQKLGK